MSTPAMKIGPYGGPGGNHWDINALNPPKRLVSIQIWSTDSSCEGAGGVVNGISFSYLDMAGPLIPSGPWGSQTGKPHVINIGEDERLITVYGTSDGKFVTSLKFVTDRASDPYGPYGAPSTISTFSFQGGSILAFLGRSSEKLNAIGAYKLGV
ncbi:hypothetical protein VPH35_011877 [Triticum aestivum]